MTNPGLQYYLLKKQFQQYKKESIKWSWEDFYYTAKDMGYIISKKKSQELLIDMIKHHDAMFGISWETVRTYIIENCKKINNNNNGH